jgi:hypothetical protein
MNKSAPREPQGFQVVSVHEAETHYRPATVEFETQVSQLTSREALRGFRLSSQKALLTLSKPPSSKSSRKPGYRWEGSGTERKLAAMQPGPQDLASTSIIRPLNDPAYSGMFKSFADLHLNPAAILDFANKFGGLLYWEGGDETLAIWIAEITTLRLAVALTEARSPAEIRHAIEATIRVGVVRDFSPADLRGRAAHPWVLVRELANKRFDLYTVARCLSSPKTFDAITDGRLNCVIVPRNLLGALWVQFIQAVEAHVKFPKCKQCGTPFEISGRADRGRQRNAMYCLPAPGVSSCKMKAYRARLKQKSTVPRKRKRRAKAARLLAAPDNHAEA